MTIISNFCSVIRRRSKKNQEAIKGGCIVGLPPSPTFSILRQELDSMVRVIFLLNIKDNNERMRYTDDLMNGVKWKTKTTNGKIKTVLDKDMIGISQNFRGWT